MFWPNQYTFTYVETQHPADQIPVGQKQWAKIWSKEANKGKQVVICYFGWQDGLSMSIVNVKCIRPWTAKTISQFENGATMTKQSRKRARVSKTLLKALKLACCKGNEWAAKTIEERQCDWRRNYRITMTPRLQKAQFQEASELVKRQLRVEKRTRQEMAREDSLAKTLRKQRKREEARRKVSYGWGW